MLLLIIIIINIIIIAVILIIYSRFHLQTRRVKQIREVKLISILPNNIIDYPVE